MVDPELENAGMASGRKWAFAWTHPLLSRALGEPRHALMSRLGGKDAHLQSLPLALHVVLYTDLGV